MSRVSAMANGNAGRSALPAAFLLVLASVLSCAPFLAAQSNKAPTDAKSGEEFFIVSSVDMAKKELLLKEPTEITELLHVNEKTRYTDKKGKEIEFADLRAGDTVYIRWTTTPVGKLALSIRKGPMTLEELHRHYLK